MVVCVCVSENCNFAFVHFVVFLKSVVWAVWEVRITELSLCCCVCVLFVCVVVFVLVICFVLLVLIPFFVYTVISARGQGPRLCTHDRL